MAMSKDSNPPDELRLAIRRELRKVLADELPAPPSRCAPPEGGP